MDWLTFTAEMFKAGVWPALALIVTLLFRSQLRTLVLRLNKGRLGPAEFEFEQALQVLSAQWPGSGPMAAAGATAAVARPALPARDAIAAAWQELERALQARPQPVPLAAQDLALYQQLEALYELSRTNAQFHPSALAVDRYARLTRVLQARLKGHPSQPG